MNIGRILKNIIFAIFYTVILVAIAVAIAVAVCVCLYLQFDTKIPVVVLVFILAYILAGKRNKKAEEKIRKLEREVRCSTCKHYDGEKCDLMEQK